MMNWKSHILIGLLAIILGISCAQIGTLGGGVDDIAPPEVLTEGSTPNMQTRFSDRSVELYFNEWITVANTTKEIFISPPLNYPLKVTDKGKKIIVEFHEDEVLKENTTYQINFGKSIKDLTAGNFLENYTFLFSTGDKLDELAIKGKVEDALSGKGVGDLIVSLYDDLSDTCFTTVKPLYLTRTDKEGNFELQNLRGDTFQIFALADENVSYTYDLQTEKVAYLDSFLILNDKLDTLSSVVLELFDEEDEPRFVEARQRRQGLVKVVYNPLPTTTAVNFLDSMDVAYYLEEQKDTLYFWHDDLQLDSAKLVAVYPQGSDTFNIKAAKKSMTEMNLLCQTKMLNLDKEDTIYVEWNKPLQSIDTSMITLADTSGNILISQYGTEGRNMWLLADLRSAQQYSLKIDSAAITDWYEKRNLDSLELSIKTIDRETLGTILLSVTKDDKLSYLVELISENKVIEKRNISAAEEISLTKMPAGQYSLKITQDSNGDGRWSSGSLKERTRPERIKKLTLEKLKAGWDLEATVDLRELFYGTESN